MGEACPTSHQPPNGGGGILLSVAGATGADASVTPFGGWPVLACGSHGSASLHRGLYSVTPFGRSPAQNLMIPFFRSSNAFFSISIISGV